METIKYFICANTRHEDQVNKSKNCVRLLESKFDVRCVMPQHKSIALFGDESHKGTIEDCSIVVSIGGDGAVLRASLEAVEANLPLLGINTGHLGYLCALTVSDLENNPDPISNFKVSKRSMLDLEFEGKTYTALNDIVVAKEYFGATVTLSVLQNSEELSQWRGDGLIISTPTGSSAYNYSAGGPILSKDSDNLVITPICPHSGSKSSFVVNGDTILSVVNPQPDDNKSCVYVDGYRVGILEKKISIKRSKKTLSLLVKQ